MKRIVSRALLIVLVLLCSSKILSQIKYSPRNYAKHPGHFSLVTYNIAGLPDLISKSTPSQNTSDIGGKLASFDLVALQENFWYSNDLLETMLQPYRPPLKAEIGIGSGLSVFSKKEFLQKARVNWTHCSGVFVNDNDCLAPKGFTWGILKLDNGLPIHFYDTHFDAGNAKADIAARSNQFHQLAQFILKHSGSEAVIVAGDINAHLEKSHAPDWPSFNHFTKITRLNDSCHALQCPQEKLDRILYRESPVMKLRATQWNVLKEFTNESGQPLSDHDPVRVEFEYQGKGKT